MRSALSVGRASRPAFRGVRPANTHEGRGAGIHAGNGGGPAAVVGRASLSPPHRVPWMLETAL